MGARQQLGERSVPRLTAYRRRRWHVRPATWSSSPLVVSRRPSRPITHPPQTVDSAADVFRSVATPWRRVAGNRRPRPWWIITECRAGRPAAINQRPLSLTTRTCPAAAAGASEWISKFYVSQPDNPSTGRRGRNDRPWPAIWRVSAAAGWHEIVV